MSQLELINMGEVARQEVDWLYDPYLPFGKISIVQGDPGEGKTLLMMAIIARLSRGEPLFSEAFGREPMTCIYQTAEDGLGDTIKPRLEDAGADCSRVFVVNEDKAALTFTDARIEDAITATGARLLILDPLQAYLGAQVDMHRANEVRPAFHALAGIAQRTGCAIVLVGHMNKTKGQGGLYRGLGSIDIAGGRPKHPAGAPGEVRPGHPGPGGSGRRAGRPRPPTPPISLRAGPVRKNTNRQPKAEAPLVPEAGVDSRLRAWSGLGSEAPLGLHSPPSPVRPPPINSKGTPLGVPLANHANLDTNAPHLASQGAFSVRVGCKLLRGGVHLATGRGALWRRWGAFPEGGVHLDNHLQPNSVFHGIIYK